MVTVEQAKKLLMKNIGALIPVKIKIEDAVNSVLAENILSPLNLPPYPQSAMDGYAIKFNDRKKSLKIIGEIKAGDKKAITVLSGEAIRIFTGARVPDSVSGVVIQENTTVVDNKVFIMQDHVKRNENIRLEGSQIRKGEIALNKGTVLNPAAIGFIASLGINNVRVFRKPEIAIIVTGNELQKQGKKLDAGQIYESNSFALNAVLRTMNIRTKNIYSVKDRKKDLLKIIGQTLSIADIIIISGGISVGKYDLVKECLEESDVAEIFYKVAQKPGKPLFVGKYLTPAYRTKEFVHSAGRPTLSNPSRTEGREGEGSKDKIIFALPGNPAATLVCFYEYVYPVIKKMSGFNDCFLPVKMTKIIGNVKRYNDRALFLKGKLVKGGVMPLEGQESYMMKSFAASDVLIYLPPVSNNSSLKRVISPMTEEVEVHLI